MENVSYVNFKFKKPKPLTIAIGVAVVLLLVSLYLAKGILVAATVNGSPISRFAVIAELEKQGGKQTLEGMITQKLIEAELAKQKIIVTPAEVDDEIKRIEAQVASEGGTFAEALAAQGMTEEKLREQITIQKKIEKLLSDKIAVSEAEVDSYIKDNKATLPQGMKTEDWKTQFKTQLMEQKLQQEAQKWISDLKASAKIDYYVTY